MSNLSFAIPSLKAGNLNSYIRSVAQIPRLTALEESELAKKSFEEGDVSAAERMVLSTLAFVVHMANKQKGYGFPQEEMIQQGNFGLMKAVKQFNPASEVRFISYAVWWIRAEMLEFVLKNSKVANVATKKSHRKLFYKLNSQPKALNNFSAEEVKDIANKFKVSIEDVLEMEKRLGSPDLSFDAKGIDTDSDSQAYSPEHYLEQGNSNVSVLHEENQMKKLRKDALLVAMETLSERDKDIVKSRWLDDIKTKLQVLATKYGISVERVRQLEVQSIRRLHDRIILH